LYRRGVGAFVLVHGAWHGPWCWDGVVRELEGRGHSAVAVDLPSDDPAAGIERYAEVVSGALGDAGDVVLVGHSLAGLVIPLVAARRPVSRLVYVCALLPAPGRSLRDQLADADVFRPGFPATARDDLGRSYWPDAGKAIAALYAPDCADVEAERAVARLRPQAAAPSGDRFPLPALPAVPSLYVLCTEDRAVDPAWSRAAARERLGVEAVELPGGHSPMISRPARLADVIAG
jgi:hypothetical protein